MLPIDVIPTASGVLRFRWKQTVYTPIGPKIIEHESPLPVTLEDSVAKLVSLAKQQPAVIEKLRSENEEYRGEGDRRTGKKPVQK